MYRCVAYARKSTDSNEPIESQVHAIILHLEKQAVSERIKRGLRMKKVIVNKTGK